MRAQSAPGGGRGCDGSAADQMANACQHPDQPGYQVADPQSGNGLCSHATIEDAVACAAASNRVRPLMNGEKAADSWLFVRATPGPACHACGHPKAA